MAEEMADKDVLEVNKTSKVGGRGDERRAGRGRGRPGRSQGGGQKQARKTGQRARSGNKRDGGNGGEWDLDVSLQEELMSGGVRVRGRRAQVSINHLLQFQLPEIERQHGTGRKSGRRKNDGATQVHLHGDSFINANYRLLVDDSCEYRDQGADPNVPVPQEKIVRVIVPRGQNCPICLAEEPVAPQMVACGHIFCLSCLINFFSVEESQDRSSYAPKKRLRECPLCGSIVRSSKVKPVLVEEIRADEIPEAGTETSLKLMCKPHGSILPLPVELGIDPLAVGNVPSLDVPQVADYAHTIKCSSSKAIDLFQKDIDGIKTQYEIDRILYNDDGKYYKMAWEELGERIAKISGQQNDDRPEDIEKAMELLDLGVDLKAKYQDSNAFFFYQTSFHSSTRFFLSPLDVKILLSAFRHYSGFPETLQITVENVNYASVLTPEMISRYKYFGHLPFGTEIAFIEVDWRENPILPKEVYQQFNSELKQRRRKLTMKKQKEDKLKLNYQKRLEREHAEFYRRENGEPLSSQEAHALTALANDYLLDSLSSPSHGKSPERTLGHSHKERTIWGTSIPVAPDEKSSKENQEFEAMLLQRMQQEDKQDEAPSTNGKKSNKKKGKVMLFSNTHRNL
ncbi:hypothetical protein HG536_0C05690 [Torulaspora globosa]|uniref:RING-type domain-containing protein n=1 Tax=Torulaspora globosa TaxID=48254 RepID=A0A7G3ZFW4_9SACH|nr:uncharacterized protein HG536_0C05690 [Torulaspora globosa]QLL32400.1 hypothetical protein HG536_0C05690 [Torulaspora globosa]